MKSLSARLLVSVSVLLLLFFGVTIVVLDTAFISAGEQAREEILDGYLMQLLAAAEPEDDGHLALPEDLVESRFNAIGSGLYAELLGQDNVVLWQSRSALGLSLPGHLTPAPGEQVFMRESLDDGTPLLTLLLAVQWEFGDGQLRPYVFKVAESLDGFNAQVAGFRRQLFGWFAAVAVLMLMALALLLRRLLAPLRQIEHEIAAIEEGERQSLSDRYPAELIGVARNMNLLIDSERARSDRYRYTLDNLAHSLKTPLATIRALLGQPGQAPEADKIDEQVERMDEIVRYQLRKPAAASNKHILTPVPVEEDVARLVAGMRKVYRDKELAFDAQVAAGVSFRGDSGDFLELAGNLLDNACKFAKSRVSISVSPIGHGRISSGIELKVGDDGPGIPEAAADAMLARGVRLDETKPGHGIGLAIVRDIAKSYKGEVRIGRSHLGGAEVCVRIPPISEFDS